MTAGEHDDPVVVPFVPVRDMAASRDFYERDLGLELVREEGGRAIFAAPGGGLLGLCQHDSPDPLPAYEHVVIRLATHDVDGLYRRLRSVGAETESRPGPTGRDRSYGFSARDPDGYRIAVERPNGSLRRPDRQEGRPSGR